MKECMYFANCNLKIGWKETDNFSFSVCDKQECDDVGSKILKVLAGYQNNKFTCISNGDPLSGYY